MVENEAASTSNWVQELEKQVLVSTECLDGLEDRSRQENLWIYGIPEGTGGGDPVKFFEAWIPKFLNIDTRPW